MAERPFPYRAGPGGGIGCRVLAGILLTGFVVLALASAVQKSATWDETHYLGLGAYLIENGRWDVPSVLLHPPLSYYLNSLPLLFAELDRTCFQKGDSRDIPGGVRRGQCLLRNSAPAGDPLLLLARLPTILLGVLLGCFVYQWAFLLFGKGGALLSLFLYCLSPNIMAHTRLITPDLPLAAFGFISSYYFWRTTRDPGVKPVILCGLSLGLALLSKYSGLLWIPVMVALSLGFALEGPLKPFRPSKITFDPKPMIKTGGIVAIALLVLAMGYGFQLSPYLSGTLVQEMIVGRGLPAFLDGVVSPKGGWWTYYLTAFLYKVPIPMLLFILGSVSLWTWKRPPGRFTAACLLFPVLIFFVAFSALTKVNTGLRYILPVFPFLAVFSGSLAGLRTAKRSVLPLILIPLLLWYAYEGLSIRPHYLAYFNQLAGGPRHGYRHLVDSNLDWGQDLKGLKEYMDRKGIKNVQLSYFGTADPAQYDIQYQALPSFMILNPPSWCAALKKGDVIAVSATNLYPVYLDLGGLGDYLRAAPPKDHIGYSIRIYQLEEDWNRIPAVR